MMFSYNLSQCNDWKNCHLDPIYEANFLNVLLSPNQITEDDQGHWHLQKPEGGDWIHKTREGCLDKLLIEVNRNYDRLYDDQGNHRAS